MPDLPGCSAHGRGPADAAREAEDAIALWLETARADGAQSFATGTTSEAIAVIRHAHRSRA